MPVHHLAIHRRSRICVSFLTNKC